MICLFQEADVVGVPVPVGLNPHPKCTEIENTSCPSKYIFAYSLFIL